MTQAPTFNDANDVKFPYVMEKAVGPQSTEFEVMNIKVDIGLKEDNFNL